jgi:hypothetical protein
MKHTHRAARRGDHNPLQVARRQQLQLLPWAGMVLCAVLVGIIWFGSDLSQTERLALRLARYLGTVVLVALIRRWLQLEQRIRQRPPTRTPRPR